MTTAIQELIERIVSLNKIHDDAGLLTALDIAKELIEKEKQQIIDAYHLNPKESKWGNIGISYYNETFKK